jgi:hypothetical protein
MLATEFVLSKEIANTLERSLQIKLSKSIIPVIQEQFNDSFMVFLVVCHAFLFFYSIKWAMFTNICVTMIVSILINFITNFFSFENELVKLYNLAIFFICFQFSRFYISSEFYSKIIGNVQWLLSGVLVQVTRKYMFDNNVLCLVFIFTILIIFQWFDLENDEFYGLWAIAGTQITQDTVVNNTPSIFLIPSLITILYLLLMVTKLFPVAQNINGYMLYHSGTIIYQSFIMFVSAEILIFCACIAWYVFAYLDWQPLLQVTQNLLIIVVVDYVILNTGDLFQVDPCMTLIVFIYTLHFVTSWIVTPCSNAKK